MTGGKRKRRIILDISFFVLRHSIVACCVFLFLFLSFFHIRTMNTHKQSAELLSRYFTQKEKDNRVALLLISSPSHSLFPLPSPPSSPFLCLFLSSYFSRDVNISSSVWDNSIIYTVRSRYYQMYVHVVYKYTYIGVVYHIYCICIYVHGSFNRILFVILCTAR